MGGEEAWRLVEEAWRLVEEAWRLVEEALRPVEVLGEQRKLEDHVDETWRPGGGIRNGAGNLDRCRGGNVWLRRRKLEMSW
jgi:hypothetical protein